MYEEWKLQTVTRVGNNSHFSLKPYVHPCAEVSDVDRKWLNIFEQMLEHAPGINVRSISEHFKVFLFLIYD